MRSHDDHDPQPEALGPHGTALLAPRREGVVDRRVAFVVVLAALVALAAGVVAQLLGGLIALVTNLAFHQRLSVASATPLDHHLGLGVVLVPVVGGLAVGLMARYGSPAIRGHGIPEAMEQVLKNESRIPKRMMLLKPLSAAIAIGTGGPFGAEGPIIATGGAIGSWVGQIVAVTADERKTLLASGAAAGMAATFGSPVAAVLLAIELLLFEYRARSVVPVALAACVATSVRMAFVGAAPVFPMPDVPAPTAAAMAAYVLVGALLGGASVAVTRLVYAIEDAFEKLPIAFTWWPAIGGVAVGVIGYLVPRTLGVGYANIADTVRGDLFGSTLLVLCVAKLASWAISLGSGTSGGTLAPLFTIGGALGALATAVLAQLAPHHAIDPRVGALVGMAAMFAGASRALLASAVFAFECTRQPIGLLPLLGGCASAYFVSSLLMPSSIMTEKLVRRGVRVLSEYEADFLDGVFARDHMTSALVVLDATLTVAEARRMIAGLHHQGFPVLSGGRLVGVVAGRDVLDPAHDPVTLVACLVTRAAVVVHPTSSLREAADHMIASGVGRVVVVREDDPGVVLGILTRSDLLAAHERRLGARAARDVSPSRRVHA